MLVLEAYPKLKIRMPIPRRRVELEKKRKKGSIGSKEDRRGSITINIVFNIASLTLVLEKKNRC